MNGIVRRRASARRDLVMNARYFAREAGFTVANRFLDAVETTLDQLARQPGLGTRYELESDVVGELRVFPVTRFRKHLIFYRSIDGGIELVRVLHGAREIHPLLAKEFGIDDTVPDADE
ncbi:type II toxin-antitoxin system RelE/ParE family toxin [Tautonia rosea]|uniref:type II toxin-antitoxin system RelE/ParE family toxin n=1 Tax=Tautonia rosea TaxID=2728037 RepID=UPI001473B8EF|nr:type II toxin-antitoxin system RelE/ParE family toxin [Tautonia rosea]